MKFIFLFLMTSISAWAHECQTDVEMAVQKKFSDSSNLRLITKYVGTANTGAFTRDIAELGVYSVAASKDRDNTLFLVIADHENCRTNIVRIGKK
jgi:hypothetical protein